MIALCAGNRRGVENLCVSVGSYPNNSDVDVKQKVRNGYPLPVYAVVSRLTARVLYIAA